MNSKGDVLKVQTYLVDTKLPFLCREQTLESWNFNIYGPEKMLEINMKNSDEQGKKFLRMEDTVGGHYGIVLETRKEKGDSPFEDEVLGILFMEDKKG